MLCQSRSRALSGRQYCLEALLRTADHFSIVCQGQFSERRRMPLAVPCSRSPFHSIALLHSHDALLAYRPSLEYAFENLLVLELQRFGLAGSMQSLHVQALVYPDAG